MPAPRNNLHRPISKTNAIPVPRCPNCDAILEEAQLYWDGEMGVWCEAWGCDSCHTNHIFPARIEFLEAVHNSQQLPRHNKMLYLPK